MKLKIKYFVFISAQLLSKEAFAELCSVQERERGCTNQGHLTCNHQKTAHIDSKKNLLAHVTKR